MAFKNPINGKTYCISKCAKDKFQTYTIAIILLIMICSIPLLGDDIIEDDEQVQCLAKNIYFEARSSSLADQAAVADVVLNRVDSIYYPNTICEVVQDAIYSSWWKKKGKLIPLKNQCQFSWFCDGQSDEPTNITAWVSAQYLAYKIYYHYTFKGITEGATHYHAKYVKPYWATKFQFISRIGDHLYYKEIR